MVRRIVIALLVLAASSVWAADAKKMSEPVEVSGPEAEKRAALWQAFSEASRDDVRVYAESPQLTQICYRTGGKTRFFSLRNRAVEEIVHAKAVPFVNRITYERTGEKAEFVLWYNGAEQLRVGVDPE